MRYLSLFSGIGGFDLGFDRAGLTCVGQVEINEYCRRVLEKHWPDVKRIADIRKVKGDEFGAIDVICGGFPCQPHSVAGKQRGAADDRDLWPEYRRLITTIRPTWVVGENVPGIVHTILDEIISDLEDLHYEVVTFDIPAIAFDAPHIRRRIFIVAHAEGGRIDGGLSTTTHIRVEDEQESDVGGEKCMAHANQPGLERRDSRISEKRSGQQLVRESGSLLAHTECKHAIRRHDGVKRREWSAEDAGETSWPGDGFENVRWQPEPGVGRVADGVPRRVDRLRALGNAVVPQITEWLGRQILMTIN